MDSILLWVKRYLSIEGDSFDTALITAINAAIFVLRQLNGVTTMVEVTGYQETWTDLLGDTPSYSSVKNYICLYVKLNFDPPANSFLVKIIEDQISELQFRILTERNA